ncbi:hypothetical protein EGW08_014704 [Elysia chlorotica]|uniref:Uncharacterized protein n=1 Tax=Elysia chlorotica TaxID=188477 RepID=A0A433T7Q3_ELYCH|nr:hypothetical protein EGW08_014704 [Elysia chlorotica]
MAANNGSAATGVSFADWRRATNDSLMSTAESLLERLEDVADMLLQIDEAYTKSSGGEAGGTRPEIVERFHEGVENARSIIGVLKKEKWRLSRREMSVEMRMGELEDYKSHLQSDMSSLNQTVDVLSLRVVQLENQLADAQETQEQLEAEIAEHKASIEEYKGWLADSRKQNAKLKKNFELLEAQTPHTLVTENTMVKNEIAVLMDENQKLKELIRSAETVSPPASDDHLNRLTRDFLRQLSSLDQDSDGQKWEEEQNSQGGQGARLDDGTAAIT